MFFLVTKVTNILFNVWTFLVAPSPHLRGKKSEGSCPCPGSPTKPHCGWGQGVSKGPGVGGATGRQAGAANSNTDLGRKATRRGKAIYAQVYTRGWGRPEQARVQATWHWGHETRMACLHPTVRAHHWSSSKHTHTPHTSIHTYAHAYVHT